jgi:Na+/H+-dicarboxylate symporter
VNRLARDISIAMLAGVMLGYIVHQQFAADAASLATAAEYLKLLPDIFLKLIKMIIAPLVFATIVVGIAHMGDSAKIGRIGLHAMLWFLCASVVSLSLGLVLVNVFEPGYDLSLVRADSVGAAAQTVPNLREFLLKLFPSSVVEAMASNNILQILVFSLFAGAALAALKSRAQVLLHACEQLGDVMLQITHYVMRLAPLAVFGALASVIATNGLGILVTFGKLVGEFYLGLGILWLILIAVGFVILGARVKQLLRDVREPILVAFSTASSEAALPKFLEQLTKFGVPRQLSGFMLPLGYSFNLDGSMMYMSFATLFIAQAYGIDLGWQTQLIMLLTLMVTSKGIASVPRASLVVVTATLASFGLPVEGVALILGIDQIMDMGRTGTNVVGNAIATASIAKLNGMLGDPPRDTELVASTAVVSTEA